MSERSLEAATVDQLRSVHALKSGALAMFDPMLAKVEAEGDQPETSPEVAELLGRMHRAFSDHREETAEHMSRLAERLRAAGSAPSSRRVDALSLGARAWVRAGSLGGQNHGANARNAFVFEHLEIASLETAGATR